LNENPQNFDLEFTQRERGFLKRIVGKYTQTPNPIVRSVLIFSVLIVLAHGIERSPLPGWAAFVAIYFPALFLFHRYRKFGIFKSRIMRKLALQSNILGENPTKKESPPQ
jgi:hypothetical protein